MTENFICYRRGLAKFGSCDRRRPNPNFITFQIARNLVASLESLLATAMGNNYVFSLQPTFTQGLILGQLSILVLLVLILKYLFLDSTEYPFETSSYHPRVDNDLLLKKQNVASHLSDSIDEKAESAEWFNMLLHQASRSPGQRNASCNSCV